MLRDLPDSICIGFVVVVHLEKFRVPLGHRWKHLQVEDIGVGALWSLVFELPTPCIKLSLYKSYRCEGRRCLLDGQLPRPHTAHQV